MLLKSLFTQKGISVIKKNNSQITLGLLIKSYMIEVENFVMKTALPIWHNMRKLCWWRLPIEYLTYSIDPKRYISMLTHPTFSTGQWIWHAWLLDFIWQNYHNELGNCQSLTGPSNEPSSELQGQRRKVGCNWYQCIHKLCTYFITFNQILFCL